MSGFNAWEWRSRLACPSYYQIQVAEAANAAGLRHEHTHSLSRVASPTFRRAGDSHLRSFLRQQLDEESSDA